MALPFRRRRPAVVFVVAAAADTGLVALGYRPGFPVATAVALYYLASDRPLGVADARVGRCWLRGVGARERARASARCSTVGWRWPPRGSRASARDCGARSSRQLEERARRAEREAENERRLAVAEERARIARDLHDSAGHAINVIGVLAGAARLRGEPAGETLETIETIARDTVGELDGLLRALREGDAETTPTGLASLDTLLSHHTACGLDVTLRAAGPARPLAGSVDQAAYRILQEALTNAARHGTGSARVDLAFRDAGIELTVVNPVLARDRNSRDWRPRAHRHARACCAHRRGVAGRAASRDRSASTPSCRTHAKRPDRGRRRSHARRARADAVDGPGDRGRRPGGAPAVRRSTARAGSRPMSS